LEELIEAMSNLGGGGVTLSTENYEFDSLDDAAKHFGSRAQHEFKVGTKSSPWAQVEFNSLATRLFVGRGPDSLKVFHELNEIIRRRQRFPAVGYNMLLLVAWGVAGGAVSNLFKWPWELAPALVSLPWFSWGFYVRLRRHSVLIFQPRSEARPFFERNKDQLLMYLITFVLGGLLVFAGTQVKDRFFPASTPSTSK
jgi:hypothetical protein